MLATERNWWAPSIRQSKSWIGRTDGQTVLNACYSLLLEGPHHVCMRFIRRREVGWTPVPARQTNADACGLTGLRVWLDRWRTRLDWFTSRHRRLSRGVYDVNAESKSIGLLTDGLRGAMSGRVGAGPRPGWPVASRGTCSCLSSVAVPPPIYYIWYRAGVLCQPIDTSPSTTVAPPTDRWYTKRRIVSRRSCVREYGVCWMNSPTGVRLFVLPFGTTSS